MDTLTIEKKFSLMGARVKIAEPLENRFRTPAPFSIDVRKDEEGEFFDIRIKKEIDMIVMGVQKKDRHLLLNVKTRTTRKPNSSADMTNGRGSPARSLRKLGHLQSSRH
jgi:hypothetical protein